MSYPKSSTFVFDYIYPKLLDIIGDQRVEDCKPFDDVVPK